MRSNRYGGDDVSPRWVARAAAAPWSAGESAEVRRWLIAQRFGFGVSGRDAILSLNALIMPSAVSMPIIERTCGASLKERRPVPQPSSRTSNSTWLLAFILGVEG